MVNLAENIPIAFFLNNPEFPDSCPLTQFAVAVNISYMLINRANINIIQYRHHAPRQPDIFILATRLYARRPLADESDISQILRSGTANRLLFLHRFIHSGILLYIVYFPRLFNHFPGRRPTDHLPYILPQNHRSPQLGWMYCLLWHHQYS